MEDRRTNGDQFVSLDRFVGLYDAAQNGHMDFVKQYLDKDIINEVGPNGRTLLEEACFGGHATVVAFLLEAGADVLLLRGDRPLHIACERVRTDVVKLLLELKHRISVDMKDKHLQTPLHVACAVKSASRVVEILLQAGASVDEHGFNGQTPLHIASSNGIIHIVDTLLQYGANINVKDSKNHTSLDIAVAKGRVLMSQFLLNRGASVNTHDIAGVTPLHRACQQENAELIELLIQFGANVNAPDHHGVVPIHMLSFKNSDNLEMLLDYGAGMELCTKEECSCRLTVINCLYFKSESRSSIRKDFEKQFIKRRYNVLEDGSVRFPTFITIPELADYKEKCEAELLKMKSDRIENSVITFFDVLQRGTSAKENWQQLGWEQFDASEVSSYLGMRYPNYGRMIFCSYLHLKPAPQSVISNW